MMGATYQTDARYRAPIGYIYIYFIVGAFIGFKILLCRALKLIVHLIKYCI